MSAIDPAQQAAAARLVEALNAAELMVRLCEDPEITSPEVRNLPSGDINPAGGVGSVEDAALAHGDDVFREERDEAFAQA